MTTSPPTRILLLEDNAADAELERRRLGELPHPFELELVDDEPGFVRALHEFQPDIVLADYRLPTFSGPKALELAQEHCPTTPFVFVSGTLGEDVAVETLRWGATDYVVKDRLERLVPVVERALQEVQEQQERCAAQEALRRRDAILAAIAYTGEQLLREPFEDVIDAVLERLGTAAEAQHATFTAMWTTDSLRRARVVADWARPGQPKLTDVPDLADLDVEAAGLGVWWDRLVQGETYFELHGLAPAIQEPVSGLEIATAATVPVCVGGSTGGALSLTHGGPRDWSEEEIEALRTAANMLGSSIDRARMQAALVESEARFRRLAENAPDIIYRFNLTDMRFEYASPALAEIMGVTPTELLTDPLLFVERAHPEDREQLLRRLTDPGEPGEPVPLRWFDHDGRTFWLELRSAHVHDEHGRLVAFEGIARDITAQEEMRLALQERLKELTCLSQVLRMSDQTKDVTELCRFTADALVPALHFPEDAGARVQIDDIEHISGCVKAADLLIVPITAAGRKRGQVAVGYDGTMLPEEHALVETVATILGSWLEQAETDTALAESEARFRRLVENAPDIVYRYRVGAKPGLEYISPAIEQVTGFTAAEHLAGSLDDPRFIHPDDQRKLGQRLADEGGEGPFLVRFRTKGGGVRWIEHRITGVRDAAGQLVAMEGIGRDVTEHVAATAGLQARAREQAAVAQLGGAALTGSIDELFDASVALVAETLHVDLVGVVELLSDTEQLLLRAGHGWPDGLVGALQTPLRSSPLSGRALATGEPAFSADLGAEASPLESLIQTLGLTSAVATPIRGRLATFGTLGVSRRDAAPYSDEEVNFIQAVANILGEAVERERAEDAVERREREFRTIAEHSPDIIVRFDRELRHLYVNPTVEQHTGIPTEQFIGRTNRELDRQPEELLELWERIGEQVVSTGEAAILEYTYPGPSGNVDYESHMIPELGSDGRVESMLVVARDITARLRAEEQRRGTLARIVTAQEEERARIAEDIHDDSIQVMTAVGMRLEALKRQLSDPQLQTPVGSLEETVRRSITRLRSLMFELRPPELDREGLAPALCHYLETTVGDGLPVWEVLEELSRSLPLDVRAVLYRIAQEAIRNAVKHAEASLIQVVLDEADGGYRLRVRDDGRGFDTADLRHVGPHHLGQVSMRERAEGAGGRLDITSSPGKGTVVTIWVPSEPDTEAVAS